MVLISEGVELGDARGFGISPPLLRIDWNEEIEFVWLTPK